MIESIQGPLYMMNQSWFLICSKLLLIVRSKPSFNGSATGNHDGIGHAI